MFENVRIEVTAAHIRKGVPEDCTACPLALATRDAIPLATDVDVGPEICFHFDGRVYLGHDESAEEFVCALDSGEEVDPEVFIVSFKDIGAVQDAVSLDTLCSLPVIEGEAS